MRVYIPHNPEGNLFFRPYELGKHGEVLHDSHPHG